MPSTLYLDTARLGQQSPSATHANLDFVRLSAKEPSSLYFERFLRDGNDAWPTAYQQRFSGLNCWRGIDELKQALARMVGVSPDRTVILANRSSQLMSFAARLLFRRCRNVLTTDMCWPPYRLLLQAEAARTSNAVSTTPVRQLALEDAASAEDITQLMASQYAEQQCDGLFLPTVDNLGVRLPVDSIIRSIECRSEVRFIVVDGAQALGHVPKCMPKGCDLFIAGCHKWLRAYNPMGIAIVGNETSQEFIDWSLANMLKSREIDDPLLRFLSQLETRQTNGYTETVNLTPLFSCRGAVHDSLTTCQPLDSTLTEAMRNADRTSSATAGTVWHAVRPKPLLRTAALMLRPSSPTKTSATAEHVRAAFHEAGIVLTAYDNAWIRLSMPTHPMEQADLNRVRRALQSVTIAQREEPVVGNLHAAP